MRMTPKAAYDDIAARSRRLLRLHDGLINRRKRRIRRDWKESFCRLMHWRLDSDLERVDSRDAVLVLRDGSELGPEDFSADALDDLLRAALTFGVSAIDRYMHERVVKGIVPALKKAPLTQRQEEFGIPAALAIKLSAQLVKARRDGRQVRPANEVRKKVQEILHKRPFQSWREIEFGFELLGVTNFGGQVQGAFGIGDVAPIRKRLNDIVHKRNLCVHEGELVRHQRGGSVKKSGISRKFVQESLEFLDDFVEKLELVSQ